MMLVVSQNGEGDQAWIILREKETQSNCQDQFVLRETSLLVVEILCKW